VKYPEAAKVYERISQQLEPWRLEGLEYYSTCLWHLKQVPTLTYLSTACLERSRERAEAMIVAGNCYSLQKEHETAIHYFNHAIKLDPQMAYAYTLKGHEYVAVENFDKAKQSYEQALTVDSRHYNAWWGLGNIAYR
jgi:anaphase-promoting complex subunit 3